MDIFCIPASVIVTSMSITRDNRFNVQLINLTQDNWALILPLSPSMLRFEVTQKGEMSKKGCDVTWDRTKNIYKDLAQLKAVLKLTVQKAQSSLYGL